MPKLQAAVPQGAPPNALLRVRLPDGREVNVRLPQGLSAGDEFVFEINDDADLDETAIGKPAAKGSGKRPSEGGGGGKQTTSGKKSSKKKSRGSNGNHDTSGRGGGGSDPSGGGSAGGRRARDGAGGAGGAPRFVSGFFSLYNQVYDILNQTNAPSGARPPSPAPHQQGGGGGTYGRKGSQHSQSSSSGRQQQQQNLVRQQSQGGSPQQPRAGNGASQQQGGKATAASSRGFLDRELSTVSDFLVAMGIGMLIGLSILLGFVAGVLWVTPIEGGGTTGKS